jgi:hypothetical protein
VIFADLVNVNNQRRPRRMQNNRHGDVNMNGAFDKAQHERPSSRLLASRMVQRKCRCPGMHTRARRSHIGDAVRQRFDLLGEKSMVVEDRRHSCGGVRCGGDAG